MRYLRGLVRCGCYLPVLVLCCCQLSHHLLLHPFAVGHYQLEHSQGTRVGSWAKRIPVLWKWPRCHLTIPLESQEGVIPAVQAVAFLHKGISSLGLERQGTVIGEDPELVLAGIPADTEKHFLLLL